MAVGALAVGCTLKDAVVARAGDVCHPPDSPKLQRAPYFEILLLLLIFLLLVVTIALAILSNRMKGKRAQSPLTSSGSDRPGPERLWPGLLVEECSLHIAFAPPHWNSGSNQKVEDIGLKLEDGEVPRNLNSVSVLKLQRWNSCPPDFEVPNSADENKQQRPERESRTSQSRKGTEGTVDCCGTQQFFSSSVSSPKRTSEIDNVQDSTGRVTVVERNFEMTSADLQTPGNKTRGNCVAGAGGDGGDDSNGDNSDSGDKNNSNDNHQRRTEFGPQKRSSDSDNNRGSFPHRDYLELPTSSRSSEDRSLETDDVDDIDDLGVKLLGYDDMKQATSDFDEDNKRLLGSGSFGKVYLGDLNLRGKDVAVAVKRYKPPKNDRPSTVRLTRRQFSSEMKALSRCQHPNIISVIAYCIDGPELCMAYELIRGGTLREALSKNNPNPPHWKDRLFIVQDLSDALNYLHSIGIIHRDVKTANILLKNDDVERVTVKLADFGLSTFWDCDKSYVSTTVMVGSRSYMPPEAFLGILSKKVDVYALGMVFYEIVTGLPPYSYAKKIDLITYMKDKEKQGYTEDMIDPRIEWCKNLPGHLLELAKLCSAMDRRQRPSMDEVLAKMRKPKFL